MIGWNSGRNETAGAHKALKPRWAALRALVALCAAGAALWLLAACSNPWVEGKPDARLGENCLRASTSGPRTRVINYVDPELCGRYVQHRGPYHVRTAPVPLTAAQIASVAQGDY